MTRRWFPLVFVMNILVLGAGVVAAALGIDDDSGPQLEVSTVSVASAAETTMAQSARFDFTMEMSGLPDLDEPILVQGQGASVGDRAEIAMDMASMLAMIEEQVGGPAPPEIADVFAEPMRMVVDGPVMYMCGPMIGLSFGLDGECGSIDYRQFGDELSEMFGGQAFATQESSLGPLLGARDVDDLSAGRMCAVFPPDTFAA